MSFTDWLLALHVLAAATLVAAQVIFTIVVVGVRNLDRPSDVVRIFRLSRPGDVLVAIGSIGTLVLGVWLAIDIGDYDLWDAWIVVALVLWAVLMEVGRRTGKVFYAARDHAAELAAGGRDDPSPELNAMLRTRTGVLLQGASIVLVAALLVVMIYKPGA
ncbi:MAG TPA: hypothetical protein VK915_00055 [Gaiellaceae bacterium]|nr:hypothetical protein [Gaiellaceae bacterium]